MTWWFPAPASESQSRRVNQERFLPVPSVQHRLSAEPGKCCRKWDLKKKTQEILFCGQGHSLISTVPAEHWTVCFLLRKKIKEEEEKSLKKSFAVAFTISKIRRTIHNSITAQSCCKSCWSRAALQPNGLQSCHPSCCTPFVWLSQEAHPYAISLQVPKFSILARQKARWERAAPLCAETQSGCWGGRAQEL